MNPEIQRQFARLSSSDSTAIATRALKAVLRWFLFKPTSHPSLDQSALRPRVDDAYLRRLLAAS